jgi:hypothetical protein
MSFVPLTTRKPCPRKKALVSLPPLNADADKARPVAIWQAMETTAFGG